MFKFPDAAALAAKTAPEEDPAWEPSADSVACGKAVGSQEAPVLRCHARTFHASTQSTSGSAAGAAKRVPASDRLSELPADGCMDAADRAVLGVAEGVQPRNIPLGLYDMTARVAVSLPTLCKSPFFRDRFRPTGAWHGRTEVLVELPSARLFDAFVLALEKLGEEDPQQLQARDEGKIVEVEEHNQFELFAVGAMLQLRGLVEEAELYIAEHLDTSNFMSAVQIASYYEQYGGALMQKCFCWLKRNGVVGVSGAQEAAESAWWDHVLYDAATAELVVGQERCPASIFDGVAEAAHARKAHFFDGSHARAMAPTPVATLPNGKPGAGFPEMTRCYLERRREMGPEKNMTHFLVFTEAENKLLLAACSNMEKAEFVVADNEDFTPHGEHYVGFVSASFLGTHFTLYDHGVPAEELPDGAMPRVRRKEHCMVVYKSNILGRVPNSMRVVLGGSDGNEAVVEGGLEARLEDPSASSTINILHTKQPRWNAELDAWTMDFKGRVKLASKKNFQLINSDEPDKVLMLFGKVTKNRFTLDFRPPMTVTKALSVALSTFADKLAVT